MLKNHRDLVNAAFTINIDAGGVTAANGKAVNVDVEATAGVAIDQDDIRAHGKDERVRVSAFYDGVDFFYRFAKALAP